MKLIVQIPCLNEQHTITQVIQSIPRQIPGIDVVEVLIIDDGSTDDTIAVAQAAGADHIISNTINKGLAYSFHNGIETCLRLGADVIVNTDGDNQYHSGDIPKLVAPILAQQADIVIGDRGGMDNPHFSWFKRCLQVLGSTVIRKATGLNITDAVSGFRALSRDTAQQINIVSDFSYTIEMLVQASAKRLSVVSVPIRTHSKTRESRLFRTIPQFIQMSVSSLFRIYVMYRPLRAFLALGLTAMVIGTLPILRFLFLYFSGDGDGHIQSLVIGGTLVLMGVITILVGVVADLINFNRKLMEKLLRRVEKLDEQLHHPSKVHPQPDKPSLSVVPKKGDSP
ncbi:glycosyltransferase family 2 protein [Ferrimonas aestuarii]|uniref:Glycosyltransferase family 2 protein n=1 Tax=Ferrimonas aestuarii TaxID=2569539 RepID=A0A4U1BVA7_9GAMM|nr:glycosyltransferase family 2 protein [Ferrimonas aestuarii]TKB58404.1 glycosyltransferase family 2 protein [Ferrimonas aestuarii]